MKKIITLTCFTSLYLISPVFAQKRDTLTIGYNIAPPFVVEKNNTLEGASVWLWDEIQKKHKLPYKTVALPLDRLIEELQKGTIDLSLSPLTITSDRAEKIDFSPPYYTAHSAILTTNTSRFTKLLSYVKSFFSVNFFKALSALVVVILTFGFLEWLFERKHNHEEFGTGMKGLWNGFWWSAVTMTTVGYGDKSPKTIGGRIVALIWMFTAIIIISGFTASIASSLTVNQLGGNENKIEDFKTKKLGTINKSGTEKWLRDNFYNQKLHFETEMELAQALISGEIDAIAYDRPILQSIATQDTLNRFKVLPITYNEQFYAMGFSQNLSDDLKKKLSIAILETTEKIEWKIVLSEHNLLKN